MAEGHPPLHSRQRILDAAQAAFGPWLARRVGSRSDMKASKYELRVREIFAAVFGPAEPLVRELVLPVRVDFALRKLMTDAHRGEFQCADVIELRVDFAWLAGSELRLIEVDGSQHASATHFFHRTAEVVGDLAGGRTTALPRALRRDALKNAIVAAAGVPMLRLGPEGERDTHGAKVATLKALLAFARGEHGRPTSEAKAEPEFARWAESSRREFAGGAQGPQKRRVRSASEPRRRGRCGSVSRAAEEEQRRKMRTQFNRRCRERLRAAQRSMKRAADREAIERRLRAVEVRQLANDSRKRPRDDTGFAYDPKWFRQALGK